MYYNYKLENSTQLKTFPTAGIHADTTAVNLGAKSVRNGYKKESSQILFNGSSLIEFTIHNIMLIRKAILIRPNKPPAA